MKATPLVSAFLFLCCCFAPTLCFPTGLASAQRPVGIARRAPSPAEMAPRLYALGAAGAFGDVRVQSSALRASAPLELGGGAALGFELPVAHAFSLGAEVSAWVWGSEHSSAMDTAGSFVLDLSAVPRFRNPWSDASGAHFAVAFGFPVGPTLSFLSAGDGANTLATLGTRDGQGFGVHAGAWIEVQAFPIPHVGITFGGGYVHHFVWHHAIAPRTSDVAIDFGQPMVRLGLVVAL